VLTYLDADLFFFSDPSPIYQELDEASVLIVGHRFPPHLKYLEDHGIYNVGLLSFRRDGVGPQCLHWWRNRCLEWCYDRVEDGRFADQKYLDDWPTRFPRVVVLQHKGAGLAPWNVSNHALRLENGQVLVDTQPLVFFHFHGLKQMGRWLYNPDLKDYGACIDPLLKQHIYGLYVRELQEADRCVSALAGQSHIKMGSVRVSAGNEGSIFLRIARKIKYQLSVTKQVLQGHIWVVIDGRLV
jgi:hypothetical protein